MPRLELYRNIRLYTFEIILRLASFYCIACILCPFIGRMCTVLAGEGGGVLTSPINGVGMIKCRTKQIVNKQPSWRKNATLRTAGQNASCLLTKQLRRPIRPECIRAMSDVLRRTAMLLAISRPICPSNSAFDSLFKRSATGSSYRIWQ